MGYEGQTHTIRPHVTVESWSKLTKELLQSAFEEEYVKLYGRLLDGGTIKLVSLRCAVIGSRPKVRAQALVRDSSRTGSLAPTAHRKVFFEGGFRDCPVYDRFELPLGSTFSGPAVVQQPDTTTIIEPSMTVSVDVLGNLIIRTE